MHLAKPHLMKRYLTVTLRLSLRIGIAELLKVAHPVEPGRIEAASRKRCAFCPSSKDRKSKNLCVVCRRPICDEHRVMRCTNFIGASEEDTHEI